MQKRERLISRFAGGHSEAQTVTLVPETRIAAPGMQTGAAIQMLAWGAPAELCWVMLRGVWPAI